MPEPPALKRRRIISVSVLLALACTAAPVSLSAYLAWRHASHTKREQLATLAEQAIERAQRSFDDAHSMLATMATSPLPPCSPAHIAQMRALVFASESVQELGYFDHDRMRCTSWGVLDEDADVPRAPADYTSADGLQVTLQLYPATDPGVRMLGLHAGAYNALVNPRVLTNLVLPGGTELAVADASGHVLAETGPAAVRALLRPSGVPGTEGVPLRGRARRGEWVAVATQPAAALNGALRSEQAHWLPAGLGVSMLLVGVVVWASRKRLSPLARLQLAVQRREFVVHYQPIIALDSGACVGAEALLRWQLPDGTVLGPDRFVALAERSGLISPITEQVIAHVLADLGPLLRRRPQLHVAINVQAEDIQGDRVRTMLARQLQDTGIAPRQLWIEATERSFMDIDSARDAITRLREQGHAVAIDDFGTGYSSLQYLADLPLDALKIDKSFVDTVGLGSATSSVTSHIIDMAKALGLRTVAEGVERQEQLDYLRERGVDFAQGWLFARALPAAEFIAFQRQHAGG